MTIDDFWKKYNHCPLCRYYAIQGNCCENCKWWLPISDKTDLDLFEPTEDTIRSMNREIDEV